MNHTEIGDLKPGPHRAARDAAAAAAGTPAGVLLVDDHPMTRLGVRHAVEAEPGLELLGDADDPHVALALAERLRPGLAVVDLVYPGASGFDLIRDLRVRCPACRVVAYTAMEGPGYAEQCLRAGAAAYVGKSRPVGVLLRTLKSLRDGTVGRGPAAGHGQAGDSAAGGRPPGTSAPAGSVDACETGSRGGAASSRSSPVDLLSDGEFAVYHLIAQGLSNHQIAATLHRSVKTVETYRSRIKRKLGVSNATELAQRAARELTPAVMGGATLFGPPAGAAPGAASGPAGGPPGGGGAARRPIVLIVEDHAVVREPLAKLMRHHGYDAQVASDGQQALDALAAGPVDVVVLDVMLPKLDGVAVLARMKADARWAGVPVLVVTGVVDGSMLRQVREMTPHVMTKAAFDTDELFGRVAALAGRTGRESLRAADN